MLEVASKRGWLPPFTEFVAQLPTLLQPTVTGSWDDFLRNVDSWIPPAELSLDTARFINSRTPLRRVANLIAAEAAKQSVAVKLLFDRADAIPIACAIPILELLDQDGEYLALVATRPAPHANLDWGTGVATGLRPDDQYDVIALGNAPRNLEWRTFVLEAVGAQMPQAVNGNLIPAELLDAIIYFAADSVRLALQLTHSMLAEVVRNPKANLYNSLMDALEMRQAQMLNRAKARLKPWQTSFSATRGKWREEALRVINKEKLVRPVQVTISRSREQTFLAEEPAPQSVEERFTAACLEDSVLRPPHGEFWVPGSRFSSLEIAPLLLWERDDGIPAPFTSEPANMVMSPGKFLGGSGGASPIRGGQAFVGLRFTFPASVQFFQKLKSTLVRHPMLGKIDLKNGKLPSGAKWAVEIREIIRKCSLMCIADVTGGRGDVLFELGIAHGLGRPIIPVVEASDDISRCPYWLRSFNIGIYGNNAGHAELVSSIYDHVYRRRRLPKHRLPAAVPHIAGFLGGGELYERQLNQFRSLAEKEGVMVEHIVQVTESNYEEAVNLVARASLLVLVLDDTDQDAFAHFAAGLVISNPFAGFGNRPLGRQVLVLPESRETTIPDSLVRAQPTITVAKRSGYIFNRDSEFLEIISPVAELMTMQQPRLEKRLTHLTELDIPSWSNWIGAVSFGKRSCASLQILRAAEHQVRSSDLITYTTKTGGETRAATNKSRNRETILELLHGMGAPSVSEHQISQYAATPLAQVLSDACSTAAARGGRTILDITGLTKFHTVIAAAEAAVRRFEGILTLAYSIPENYIGFDKKERYTSGFGETLILPLVDGAKMMLESRARGIVLPGHEGQRLLVALGEIDPVAGTFIHAVTPGRPDFEQVTRHRNRSVYNDLTMLGKWRDHSVDFRRMRSVSSLVRTEVRRAKANKGPLLIYPFGPKPVIFAAVFTAARLYPEGSWFVYPVPTNSSTQHTEGVSDTFWMNL